MSWNWYFWHQMLKIITHWHSEDKETYRQIDRQTERCVPGPADNHCCGWAKMFIPPHPKHIKKNRSAKECMKQSRKHMCSSLDTKTWEHKSKVIKLFPCTQNGKKKRNIISCLCVSSFDKKKYQMIPCCERIKHHPSYNRYKMSIASAMLYNTQVEICHKNKAVFGLNEVSGKWGMWETRQKRRETERQGGREGVRERRADYWNNRAGDLQSTPTPQWLVCLRHSREGSSILHCSGCLPAFLRVFLFVYVLPVCLHLSLWLHVSPSVMCEQCIHVC